MKLARILAASLSFASAAAAAELTPEKIAEIRHAEKAALKKVSEAHGNRKPGEMDNDERRKVIEEQAAAVQSVLDKAGVSARDYATYSSRMSREEQARAKAAEERIEAEAKAGAVKKAAEENAQSNIEPEVQQGLEVDFPVELEGTGGAEPRVDDGPSAEAAGIAAEAPEAKPSGEKSSPGGGKRGGRSHH